MENPVLNIVCTLLLVAAGLLNLAPVIGAQSADQLTSLYGLSIDSPDLQVLMRHRAIMLGLIGALMLIAAYRPSLQVLAASIGFVSMSSFVILAHMVGETGAEVNRVVTADIAGSIAALAVLLIAAWQRREYQDSQIPDS